MSTVNQTAKHTPGPWSADWDDNGQWYVNVGGLSVSGNALRGDSGDCVESANAHLIAAAPDLLTVLKAALDQTGCDGDLCGYVWHEEAREIIARAEGR